MSCARGTFFLERRRLILVLFYCLLACTGAWAAGAAPISIQSKTGKFVLQLDGIARPERLNHMHGFDLALTTADGEPVTGATITLTGSRAETGNPLPTSPSVFAVGRGSYRVEGLQFHMPGEWHLTFAIEVGDSHDRAGLDVTVR